MVTRKEEMKQDTLKIEISILLVACELTSASPVCAHSGGARDGTHSGKGFQFGNLWSSVKIFVQMQYRLGRPRHLNGLSDYGGMPATLFEICVFFRKMVEKRTACVLAKRHKTALWRTIICTTPKAP